MIHSDFLAKKVKYAQIVANDEMIIDFFTTYLQASYSHPSSAEEIALRKAQLDSMLKFATEIWL